MSIVFLRKFLSNGGETKKKTSNILDMLSNLW